MDYGKYCLFRKGVYCWKSIRSIAVLSRSYRRILNNGNLEFVVDRPKCRDLGFGSRCLLLILGKMYLHEFGSVCAHNASASEISISNFEF
jgi:hypothetical protein